MTRRRFVATAAVLCAMLAATHSWAQTEAPHTVRIVERSARARLPDGSGIALPAGSEISGRVVYTPDAALFDLTPTDVVFRGGFEQ